MQHGDDTHERDTSNPRRASELLKQRQEVYYALDKAAKALREAAVNGRDAYRIPGLLDRLEAQHMRRLKTIRDLQDELEAEMEGINAQGDRR